ncbi:hypothetical protein [Cohnella caldifontis]|uniref:hypothetical protein n=1 Tax=Cohnella caldifontis TaxID=3027471 RepID=UPI0023EDC96E|nr:hypothetical protein [Cohnella sp. YIM B05605]
MNVLMFIDRPKDWFFDEDVELDPFLCSIQLLERLSSRQTFGLKYNRISLVHNLIGRRSNEAINSLDTAIVILTSRRLIKIENESEFNSQILITNEGLHVLKQFKEAMTDVH